MEKDCELTIPLTGGCGKKSIELLTQALNELQGADESNLLEIKLKDTESVPEVWYRGKRVDKVPNGLVDVYMHWHTCEWNTPTELQVTLEYLEGTDMDAKRVEVFVDDEGERGCFRLLKDEID